MFNNTTGNKNTALGHNAGRYIANGTTAKTTGDNGVYLGYDSKASANGTNNEIALGYDAIGNGSNTATYGNTSITKHIFSNGNVGIGTTAPQTPLQITYTGSNYGFMLKRAEYTDGKLNGLLFSNSGVATPTYDAYIGSKRIDSAATDLVFATNPGRTNETTLAERIRITSTGYVGIGTTTPTAKLDVNGTTKLGNSTTNYTQFDANGHQTMIGTATVFDDLMGDITQVKVTGTGVSLDTAQSTVDFTTGANLSDYLIINYQLSHKWKLGSNLYPHIHWKQNSNATPNFLIQYRWQRNNQAWTSAWTNLKCNVSVFTYTSGSINQISNSAVITPPANSDLSDIIQFRVLRDNANNSTVFSGSDTYSGDAEITSVDIHFEQDTLGSNSEYIK